MNSQPISRNLEVKLLGLGPTTSNQIDKLLNLAVKITKADRDQQVWKVIQPAQQEQIENTEQEIKGMAYTYCKTQSQFILQEFTLIPNMLLTKKEGKSLYLMLSTAFIDKSTVVHTNKRVYGLVLKVTNGRIFIFFSTQQQSKDWYKALKKFCLLTKFLQKFQFEGQIMSRYYQCQQLKHQKPHAVELISKQELLNSNEFNEATHNEIQLLRSVKHPSLFDLKGVYQDDKYLYKVYEPFKGESLYCLVECGLILDETQIASLVYQLLHALKFLQGHQFYHGNLSPISCILNTSAQNLQLYINNFAFKQYKLQEKSFWLSDRNVSAFMAPEVQSGNVPSIESDLYSIGALIYYLAFRSPSKIRSKDEFEHFINTLSNFSIDLPYLDKVQKQFERRDKYSMLYSISQIDLMIRLLQTDPLKRPTIEETLKHHWFVNIKSKIKPKKDERKIKILPSLRTIIELREHSEVDLKLGMSSNFDANQQTRNATVKLSIIADHYLPSIQHSDSDDMDESNHLNSMMKILMNECQDELVPSKDLHDTMRTKTQTQKRSLSEEEKTNNVSYPKSQIL